MAAYTSLLLVITLFAATAHSLKCYTCNVKSENDECLTTTECRADEMYCQAAVEPAIGNGVIDISIIKKCALSCAPPISKNSVSDPVFCCSTDLCNYSTSIRSSCAAIILALGSILLILKSSVL